VYPDEVSADTSGGVRMRVVDEGKQGYDGELSLGENEEMRNTHLVAIRQAQNWHEVDVAIPRVGKGLNESEEGDGGEIDKRESQNQAGDVLK
jgi:hypothetical protein